VPVPTCGLATHYPASATHAAALFMAMPAFRYPSATARMTYTVHAACLRYGPYALLLCAFTWFCYWPVPCASFLRPTCIWRTLPGILRGWDMLYRFMPTEILCRTCHGCGLSVACLLLLGSAVVSTQPAEQLCHHLATPQYIRWGLPHSFCRYFACCCCTLLTSIPLLCAPFFARGSLVTFHAVLPAFPVLHPHPATTFHWPLLVGSAPGGPLLLLEHSSCIQALSRQPSFYGG